MLIVTFKKLYTSHNLFVHVTQSVCACYTICL